MLFFKITGIDLRHLVHQLMVQLLRPVPRLLIKINKQIFIFCCPSNWTPTIFIFVFFWGYGRFFLSVNLCRSFFSSGLNPPIYSLTGPLFRSNSCSFYSPVVVFHQGRFFILFLYGHTCQFFSFVFHDFLNHFYPIPTKIINVKNKDLNCFLRSKDSSH